MNADSPMTPPQSAPTGGVIETQAVIVGSGAAGAVLAKELAEAGIDVVVLEAGAWHVPERDFNQREETMLGRLFYDQGARTTTDLGVTIMHGRGVGGSTVHNISLCMAPVAGILDRWAEEYGLMGMRAPDLEPAVRRVWDHLGINPIAPEHINANNRMVQQGAERLGWRGFIPHHNRVDCLQTGFCILGCTYNRKQSMLITYVPRAQRAGARIYPHARAARVLVEGDRAVGVEVEALDPQTGTVRNTFTVRARSVILSAGALLSPALLLKSGLANSSGLLGKRLHLHPSVVVGGIFDERIEGWRGVPQTYIVDEFAHFYRNGHDGYLIIPVFAHPGTAAVMSPATGAAHASVMARYPYLSAAAPMVHDETHGTLDVLRDGRLEVRYWPNEGDQRWLIDGIRRTAELYFAAGAREVMLPYGEGVLIRSPRELDVVERRGIRKYDVAVASVHPQGSAPMSADPKQGIVDVHCETHDVRNLFVCDASVFPTSLGTPPMVPTAAVAAHTAAWMVGERRRLFE